MPNRNDIRVDPGSYRDPSGFVFSYAGGLYRAVSAKAWPAIERLDRSGLLGSLQAEGILAPTRVVPPEDPVFRELRAALPDWQHFLCHEPLPLLSYPYEWCFSMLLDAGLLQLRLQQRLLAAGLSLKDASAFNIQFAGSRPVFIDVLSVEIPRSTGVWTAYSQFCRMHLFPLLLLLHKGVSLKNTFLADLDGVAVGQVVRLFGVRRALCPDLFLDVFLQSRLERRTPGEARKLRARMEAIPEEPGAQQFNLRRLERKLLKMRSRYVAREAWSRYAQEYEHVDDLRPLKEAWLRDFLGRYQPRSVVDLGCNTGAYSMLAARLGARVVAVDGSHDCVERLYRTAAAESLPVLPLWVDLAQPSPGLGLGNAERRPFLERVRGDCVLALALVHHLLVVARMPLTAIRDMLLGFACHTLVVEFIERDDPMFQALLALRDDLYQDWTLERFQAVFSERCRLLSCRRLGDSRRHLLAFEVTPC